MQLRIVDIGLAEAVAEAVEETVAEAAAEAAQIVSRTRLVLFPCSGGRNRPSTVFVGMDG